MSRIRFKGTSSASVPTPPIGKASLFYDDSDNSLKMKLPDGNVLALGVTEEYIQDIVGNLFNDSTVINVVYDDSGNIITLDVNPGTINTSHIDSISCVKINDAQNAHFQSSIITNDNTLTTIQTLDCSIDGSWMIEAKITTRRIGGTTGSPGDGGSFKRTFRIKSIGSSVTVHDLQSDYTSKDNPSMNVTVSVNSTNVLIKVKGINNNNLKWNADIKSSINT